MIASAHIERKDREHIDARAADASATDAMSSAPVMQCHARSFVALKPSERPWLALAAARTATGRAGRVCLKLAVLDVTGVSRSPFDSRPRGR